MTNEELERSESEPETAETVKDETASETETAAPETEKPAEEAAAPAEEKTAQETESPAPDAPKPPKPRRPMFQTAVSRRKLLKLLAAEAVGILIVCLLAAKFTLHDKLPVPVDALMVTAALPILSVLALEAGRNEKLVRLLRSAGIIAWALLLAEVFVFNGKSFTTAKTDFVFAEHQITTENMTNLGGNAYEVNGTGKMVLTEVPDGLHGLVVYLKQAETPNARRFRIDLYMTDENFSTKPQKVRQDYTIGYSGEHRVSFYPYGSVRTLELNFNDVQQPVTINAVRGVCALPMLFLRLRFYLLLLLGTLAAAIKIYAFYKYTVSDQSRVPEIALNIMTIACVLTGLCFIPRGAKPIEYVEGNNYSGNDIYLQEFDALHKGQPELALPADEKIAEVSNPYDRWLRESVDDIYIKWDFAYKDGKYYSYFGIAPILFHIMPYHALTGNIPTPGMTISFFGIWAILFICFALRAGVKLLLPDANLLMLLLIMPASICACGIYNMMNPELSYQIAVSAGMCFLMLSLWLAFEACSADRLRSRFILLAISGLALASCAASRPTMAVCAAILIPLFLGILLRKTESFRNRFYSAAAFAAPLFAGVAVILWFNAYRFGSPLDFGTTYQMTVSDVHANKLSLRLLPQTLYFYFFMQPRPLSTFPYFEAQFYDPVNAGKYLYNAPVLGAFAYPMLLLGTLYLPLALRKKETCSGSATVLQRRAVLITCFSCAVLLAWVDTCMGGVIQRYCMDFLPLMVFGSTLTLLSVISLPHDRKFRFVLITAALFLTFSIGWLQELNFRNDMLCRACPNLYDTVAELVQFWR